MLTFEHITEFAEFGAKLGGAIADLTDTSKTAGTAVGAVAGASLGLVVCISGLLIHSEEVFIEAK